MTNVSKKYRELILDDIHRIPNRESVFSFDFLKPNVPVPFRLRVTGVTYHAQPFHLGLADTPPRENSMSPGHIIVRTVQKNKVVRKTVFLADIVPLILDPMDLNDVSNQDFINLGLTL